jgi:hypothetical protein
VMTVTLRCGIVGADARPNWREIKASGDWQSGASFLQIKSHTSFGPVSAHSAGPLSLSTQKAAFRRSLGKHTAHRFV